MIQPLCCCDDQARIKRPDDSAGQVDPVDRRGLLESLLTDQSHNQA
jgi:hypothetical protein